ncbi:hypothetical protein V8E53_013543 [Lactarius tabidus]
MFDTFHVPKVLEFPRTDLRRYWRFTAISQQINDTSSLISASGLLPDEMVKYAHADTHLLFYIYDNFRNALLDRTISRSASPTTTTSCAGSPTHQMSETALRVYAPDPYHAEGGTGFNGHDSLARRWNKAAPGVDGVPSVQRKGFRAAHVRRNPLRVKRTRVPGKHVLANRFALKLVQQPPPDMAALLHAKELLDVVRGAVRKGMSLPTSPSEPTLANYARIKRGSRAPAPAPTSSSLWSHSKPLPTGTASRSRDRAASFSGRLFDFPEFAIRCPTSHRRA